MQGVPGDEIWSQDQRPAEVKTRKMMTHIKNRTKQRNRIGNKYWKIVQNNIGAFIHGQETVMYRPETNIHNQTFLNSVTKS